MFVASKFGHNLKNLDTDKLDKFCKNLNWTYKDVLTNEPLELENAFIFEDDKPKMDHLNRFWIEQWRTWRKDFYAKLFLNEKKPLFK